ncbi:hypothetical protein J6590_048147 [Homalodisca vitripennis]|nr:hypothetical protein J6590_048147 [Homalodisca vitripennis]
MNKVESRDYLLSRSWGRIQSFNSSHVTSEEGEVITEPAYLVKANTALCLGYQEPTTLREPTNSKDHLLHPYENNQLIVLVQTLLGEIYFEGQQQHCVISLSSLHALAPFL